MSRYVCAVTLLLFAIGVADAGYYQYYPYVPPQQVVTNSFKTYVFDYSPGFAVGQLYAPYGTYVPLVPAPQAAAPAKAQGATHDCDQKVEALRLQMEELKRKLLAPPAPSYAPQAPQAPRMPKVQDNGGAYYSKCASCHESTAATDGGGIQLFSAGRALKLTREQVEANAKAMRSDHMPKQGKLTDWEHMAVMSDMFALVRKED